MRKLLSKQGFLALAALGVWITVIFARTHAFTDLPQDPVRISAIIVAGVSAGIFSVAVFRLFFNDQDDDE